MPRPGPRPYECVRRSWHSDRHQPIRGSIIQQIFRVVHERHSVKTKKNREWQEKLPIVVFKAEEIMYSKANSEVEYMDLDSLWDRVNEAIDIIIRKDENIETGELLPPCVEAALNLGCIPIRASRSERHSNQRSYLNPTNQQPECLGNNINDQNTPSSSLPRVNSGISLDNVGCSVYPMYYDTDFKPPKKSNTIILGRPVYPSSGPFPCGENRDSMEPCDLSLRLGPSSGSGPGYNQQESLRINKEFNFFPVESSNEESSLGTKGVNNTSYHFTGQMKRPDL